MAVRSFGRLLALLALATSVVFAHPQPTDERLDGYHERDYLANERLLAAQNCESVVNQLYDARRAERSLPEQFIFGDLQPDDNGGESVIPLELDILVIDIATCEPVSNAFVEISSDGSRGKHGDFENDGPGPARGPKKLSSKSPNPPHLLHPPGKKHTPSPSGSPPPGPLSREPSPPRSPRDSSHKGRFPPGPPPGDKPDLHRFATGRMNEKAFKQHHHELHESELDDFAPPWVEEPEGDDHPHSPHPSGERHFSPPSHLEPHPYFHSRLRIGHETDDYGVVELIATYAEHPSHLHLMVHAEGQGMLRHVGKLFLKESWKGEDMSTDSEETLVNKDGAIVQLEFAGEEFEAGLIGFVAVGIDMRIE